METLDVVDDGRHNLSQEMMKFHLKFNLSAVSLQTWMAVAPVPMTATLLPRWSKPWSQRDEWNEVPLNRDAPGNLGTLNE